MGNNHKGMDAIKAALEANDKDVSFVEAALGRKLTENDELHNIGRDGPEDMEDAVLKLCVDLLGAVALAKHANICGVMECELGGMVATFKLDFVLQGVRPSKSSDNAN